MNGKRSCWMMLIVICEICICLSKGTKSTFLARIIWCGVGENAMAGSEALRETQGPSSNEVSIRPERPLNLGLPEAIRKTAREEYSTK